MFLGRKLWTSPACRRLFPSTEDHEPQPRVPPSPVYDYLRLIRPRGSSGRVISQQTVDEMVDAVLKLDEGTKFQVLAPVVRQRKGTQQKELDAARRGGYSRVRIDGELYDLDEEITLEKNIKHTVEIVVDRLAMRKGIRGRLADSLETALALTGGIAEVDVIGGECMTFSQNFACPEHGISISDLAGHSPSTTAGCDQFNEERILSPVHPAGSHQGQRLVAGGSVSEVLSVRPSPSGDDEAVNALCAASAPGL